jgi:F420-dependent oxidoreductase-like protein
MDVSISVTAYPGAGAPEALAELARAADEHGLHTIWATDHLIQADPAASPTDPMLEAYSVLSYLAGVTRRVRLGAMVSPVTFRAPALLIKTVTTLDVLSGGRAWLGLGAGYQEDEAAAMGLPLPPVGERFEYLADTLRLADRMWRGDATAFRGDRISLDRPLCYPPSVSRPRPPVLVGGSGERHTLRLVAEYADACNLFDIPDGGVTIRRKLAVLRRHCETAGRDYDSIGKTVSTALAEGESAPAFAARCAQLRSYGMDHAVVIARGRPLTVGDVEVMAAATRT